MSEATLQKWLDEELKEGEKIEAICFGGIGWLRDHMEGLPEPEVLLTYEEAKPFLARKFDSGYGSAETPTMNVWTDKRILFVSEYDGSTSLNWFYRNPTAYNPQYG